MSHQRDAAAGFDGRDEHVVVTLVRDHKVVAFSIAVGIVAVLGAVGFELAGMKVMAGLTLVWGVFMVTLAVLFGVLPVLALDLIGR